MIEHGVSVSFHMESGGSVALGRCDDGSLWISFGADSRQQLSVFGERDDLARLLRAALAYVEEQGAARPPEPPAVVEQDPADWGDLF